MLLAIKISTQEVYTLYIPLLLIFCPSLWPEAETWHYTKQHVHGAKEIQMSEESMTHGSGKFEVYKESHTHHIE